MRSCCKTRKNCPFILSCTSPLFPLPTTNYTPPKTANTVMTTVVSPKMKTVVADNDEFLSFFTFCFVWGQLFLSSINKVIHQTSDTIVRRFHRCSNTPCIDITSYLLVLQKKYKAIESVNPLSLIARCWSH